MKLDHPCDVCFRHSALSSGTSDMPMAKGGKEHRSNITAQRYRLRALSLPRRASAQTTRTRLRCCVVASILRTLRGENPKVPARTAARALPGLPRPARQTAKPFRLHKYYQIGRASCRERV